LDIVFTKIISGGQTGVDRAGLDVALELGIPCGGWCPKGRRAEDGPLSEKYPLRETITTAYPERTRRNIQDSDGTLVLTRGRPKGGTRLTIELALEMGKPLLPVDLKRDTSVEQVRLWAESNRVAVLNVAGPRASESPEIYERAFRFLRELLS
jgi:hypothetical protein